MRPAARPLAVALLCSTLFTPALGAQAAGGTAASSVRRPVLSGDTVRVWSTAPQLVRAGAVVDVVRGDSLELRYLPGKDALPGGATVALHGLTRLEVRRSVAGSAGGAAGGVLRGAFVGGLAGVAVGAVAGALMGASGNSTEEGGAMLGAFVFGIGGGGVGAIAGAAIGGLNGGTTRREWVRVPTAP